MAAIEGLLQEFDREMKSTRRIVERVPLDKGAWKPHAKSRNLLELASHIADIPMMATRILTTTEWDAKGPRPSQTPITEIGHLLARLDEHAAAARTALASRHDDDLTAEWTFKFGERVMFTIPKATAIRNMCLSHLIHHRGQLTVYLRLLDVLLPSIYGPTADEAV
jgi:uncharacterized damage-inducible protein DinB